MSPPATAVGAFPSPDPGGRDGENPGPEGSTARHLLCAWENLRFVLGFALIAFFPLLFLPLYRTPTADTA